MLLQQKEDQLKNTVSTEMADKYKDKISSLEEEVEEMLSGRKVLEQAYAELQEKHSSEMREMLDNHKSEISTKDEQLVAKEQESKEIVEGIQQELDEAKQSLEENGKANSDLRSKYSA